MYHDPIPPRPARGRPVAGARAPLDLAPYPHSDGHPPIGEEAEHPLVAYFRDEGVRARLELAMLILAGLITARIAIGIARAALGHWL